MPKLGNGATIEIGVGATPTFTKLLRVLAFDAPDRTPEVIDITHLESPGNTRETMPGMRPNVTWSFDIQYEPDGETDTLLEGLAETNEAVQVRLDLKRAAKETYGGWVAGYTPKGLAPGGLMLATVQIQIGAKITA